MEKEESYISVISNKNGNIKTYENHEIKNFISDEEIIGLDTNVLVDLIVSQEFREELKDQISFNVLKIYTTNIALGEALHVLEKKYNFQREIARQKLKEMLNEFKIEYIRHNEAGDALGELWFNYLKKIMHINTFKTFGNDCRILSNLYKQKDINTYITEDKDIEKAIKKLELNISIKIIQSSNNINEGKIKNFFNQNRKFPYKKNKRF